MKVCQKIRRILSDKGFQSKFDDFISAFLIFLLLIAFVLSSIMAIDALIKLQY